MYQDKIEEVFVRVRFGPEYSYVKSRTIEVEVKVGYPKVDFKSDNSNCDSTPQGGRDLIPSPSSETKLIRTYQYFM